MNGSSIIVHIPHSSAVFPPHEMAKLLISGDALKQELLRMTDWYTGELFDAAREVAGRLLFPVSRLVCDPERFADDAREPMAAKGMGAVYTKTSDGRPLRASLGPDERQRILDAYYVPHHERLAQLVEDALRASNHALIIDAHSFPSSPLSCDLDQSPDRPGKNAWHRNSRDAGGARISTGWNLRGNEPSLCASSHTGRATPGQILPCPS